MEKAPLSLSIMGDWEETVPRKYMDRPYLDYYGLAEEPFSAVASPRYLFLTQTHKIALQKASFVVGGQKGMTAVFGDTGMGKSSLARRLHEVFREEYEWNSTLITNPRYPSAYAFLRTLAQEMGAPIPHKSYKDTLDVLKAFLIEKALKEEQIVTLIIDEAQEMTPQLLEVLRQLMNFESNDTKLIQIVLMAQDSLRDVLRRPKLQNFRSRIVMASTLEPLNFEETRAMISFRWTVATGTTDNHPFAAEAVREIYERSGGMPREAIVLADNALLLGYFNQQREIPAQTVIDAADDRVEHLTGRLPVKRGAA